MAIAHPKKAPALSAVLELIEDNYRAAVMHCCLRLVQAEPDHDGDELLPDELIERLHQELALVEQQRREARSAACTLKDHRILY